LIFWPAVASGREFVDQMLGCPGPWHIGEVGLRIKAV
jgi:hypothetical protein